MTYIQVPENAFIYLDNLKAKHANLSNLISEIQGELNLKLWHQLSGHMIELTSDKNLQNSSELVDLYNNVIKSVETSFNPMKLMTILKNIIKNFSNKLQDAIVFLNDINKRLKLKEGEELLFMDCLKAECLLGLNRLYECEDVLKSIKVSLEKYFDVDHIVYAYFYKLFAYYYEKKENYDEFYNYALQFFAYCKDNSITQEEKLNICYKMAVASLIGEKMYNFTELVEKDFFKVLIGGDKEWIYHLVLSLDSGNVSQYYQLLDNYSSKINNDNILNNKLNFLKLKIKISSLLNLIFQKNKNERTFSYIEISQNCDCDFDDVELLAIKALSLGLIKGHIDEIEKKLVVTWVQPKFLNREKLGVLVDRFDNWIRKANEVLFDYENQTKELFN